MKQIKFSVARKRLVVQWMVFSAIIFVIYFIQTLTGRYEKYEGEVWEWLFKFITPSLSLMIGVLISQMSTLASEVETEVFYFRLATLISYFFLVMLLLSAFLIPVIHLQQNRNLSITDTPRPITEAMKSYNIFLLPLQGICTLTLGFFFTRK
jgi:hypothetical protein